MNPTSTEQSPSPSPKPRKTNRRLRRWLPYLAAVLLVGLIVAGLWPRPVPVETAKVTLGTLQSTVNEEGKTRIRQRYTISAPVTGQLHRIPFKAGAEVERNVTILAEIEPVSPTLLDARTHRLAEARRDFAAANLEKARSAYTFASNDLRRFTFLKSENTASAQELDTAQWREASAARDLNAAESSLRQAEAELAEFVPNPESVTNSIAGVRKVKAPVTGRVLRVLEENARVVLAGTPLLEVGDPSDLEVVVDVLSRDGAAVQPGAKVELEQWGASDNSPLEGRVRLVEPAAFTKVSALGVEEQRVNVIIDLSTPPEQRRNLGDNFRVEAKILIWEANQALKVPAGALFRRGADWAAFSVAEGRAHLRSVKVGRSSGTESQILEGLKQGEEVVLFPGSRISEGQRVRSLKI